MIIEKKTWPEDFQKVFDGIKNFDVRLDDFHCKTGDTIILREWDPKIKNYTGRQIKKQVGCVAKLSKMPYWTKKDIAIYGYQVIGFK